MADICRICLRSDEPLDNVGDLSSRNADVLLKLEQCVPEVDWRESDDLYLCPKCLVQAKTFHQFKILCVRSTDMFKTYVRTVNKDGGPPKKKVRLSAKSDSEDKMPPLTIPPPLVISSNLLNQGVITNQAGNFVKATPASFVSVLPEQNNLLASAPRLIIPNTSAPNMQNVFLNLLPVKNQNTTENKIVMANNNTFYMICNTPNPALPQLTQISTNTNATNANVTKSQVQSTKFVPNILRKPSEKKDINVNKLLTQSQTEEVSVEINPLDFTLSENEFESPEDDEEGEPPSDVLCERFLNSGHFLFPENKNLQMFAFKCEMCALHFEKLQFLDQHIYSQHDGIFPYNCPDCYLKFSVKTVFLEHLKNCVAAKKDFERPITLKDLEKDTKLLQNIELIDEDEDDDGEYVKAYECKICKVNFNTQQGLRKHTLRRHSNVPQKRYFIKGSKNAYCKVCRRGFSTQSYLFIHMNQHIKRGECWPEVLEEWKKELENNKTGKVKSPSLNKSLGIDLDSENSENSKSQNSNDSLHFNINPASLLEARMDCEKEDGDETTTKKHGNLERKKLEKKSNENTDNDDTQDDTQDEEEDEGSLNFVEMQPIFNEKTQNSNESLNKKNSGKKSIFDENTLIFNRKGRLNEKTGEFIEEEDSPKAKLSEITGNFDDKSKSLLSKKIDLEEETYENVNLDRSEYARRLGLTTRTPSLEERRLSFENDKSVLNLGEKKMTVDPKKLCVDALKWNPETKTFSIDQEKLKMGQQNLENDNEESLENVTIELHTDNNELSSQIAKITAKNKKLNSRSLLKSSFKNSRSLLKTSKYNQKNDEIKIEFNEINLPDVEITIKNELITTKPKLKTTENDGLNEENPDLNSGLNKPELSNIDLNKTDLDKTDLNNSDLNEPGLNETNLDKPGLTKSGLIANKKSKKSLRLKQNVTIEKITENNENSNDLSSQIDEDDCDITPKRKSPRKSLKKSQNDNSELTRTTRSSKLDISSSLEEDIDLNSSNRRSSRRKLMVKDSKDLLDDSASSNLIRVDEKIDKKAKRSSRNLTKLNKTNTSLNMDDTDNIHLKNDEDNAGFIEKSTNLSDDLNLIETTTSKNLTGKNKASKNVLNQPEINDKDADEPTNYNQNILDNITDNLRIINEQEQLIYNNFNDKNESPQSINKNVNENELNKNEIEQNKSLNQTGINLGYTESDNINLKARKSGLNNKRKSRGKKRKNISKTTTKINKNDKNLSETNTSLEETELNLNETESFNEAASFNESDNLNESLNKNEFSNKTSPENLSEAETEILNETDAILEDSNIIEEDTSLSKNNSVGSKRKNKKQKLDKNSKKSPESSQVASLKIKINLREIKESKKKKIESQKLAETSKNEEIEKNSDLDEKSEICDEDTKKPELENEELTRNNHDTYEGEKYYGIPIEGEPPLYTFALDDNFQETQAPINLMDIEIVDGKPQCSFCKKLFGRRHDLKRHINNVHLKFIVYNCHVCSRKFYEGFHLTRHLRGHFSFITCATCLKPFCAIGELKNHHQIVHNGFGDFNCGICEETFFNLDILREHMEYHDKSIIYQCHLCEETFSECRELTKHLVEHSGMYTCLVCQKPFCSEQDLSVHVKQLHSQPSAPKRYACVICNNTYKKKRYLVIHQGNAHGISKKNAQKLIIETEDSS